MPDPSTRTGRGLHVPFIKRRLPDWTQHLLSVHLRAMTQARDPAQQFIKANPALFARTSPALRQGLLDSQAKSQTSSRLLAKTLKDFKGITEFAKPLLVEAMAKQFGQAPDVVATHLFHLRAPNKADEQSLLQAALRNFEEDEPFDEVSLQETSALAPAGSLESHLYDETKTYPFGKTRYSIRDKLPIKPAEFASLCRELDLGKQYQEHLSAVFETPATAAKVRSQTIDANKDNWRVQVHIARMRSAISAAAYTTLLAILNADPAPSLDGKAVVYSQLKLLGADVSDVVIIGARSRQPIPVLDTLIDIFLPGAEQIRPLVIDSRVIVCIPGDPLNPIKEYASLKAFTTQLAINLRSAGYQRFFAGFLPQDELPAFFRRLKSQLRTYRWNANPVRPGPNYNPAAFANGMYEEVWNDEVNLRAEESFSDAEVFGHLYERHLARVKSDALLLVVPTAQVDHDAWITRLKHWAEWGMNILNVAAFFVPGLGEVMLAVTAVQLVYEVYQGIEAWNVGDSEEAWAHLGSVIQNVAFMAVLGIAAGKAPPIVPSRFVNGMTKVALPFGKLRLWYPDLAAYKSGVSLEGLKPNALGQYQVAGKTYINLDGNVYEKTFDPALNQWHIKHPTEIDAYQPTLRHNGLGAWRHTLERPLAWDRVTLLRRMGPHMEAFSDAQLEQIVEVSGVSDDGLRAMHIDHQAPPPELSEMVRLYEADRQAGEVIEQIREGVRLDGHCEFLVPLAVEMPNWPVEEVVEVFSGPEPWGASQRFASASTIDSARPAIKITQSEVEAGKLPERVLSALDDAQISRLLGNESAKEGADRVQMFRDRLADQALRRKKALFDRLLSRKTAPDADTQALQRSFPSLSPEAAQKVLDSASADELGILRSSGRIPLRQAKEIRVHLHQGSLNRALAGLYLESLASTASDRLALHSLEQLPGWSTHIRVEVRSHGIKGPLVDSIGSEQAQTRYYVVKSDDHFRTFDAGGRALNSIAPYGRNLFESLLEVLPEPLRRSLQGDPGEVLHKQVTDYACSHRDDMSRILKRDLLKRGGRRWVRRPSGQIGYAASGEVAGFADEPLIARVRELYPNVSDEQALQFIRGRLSAGDTDQQVFHLLENRRREFESLRAVLETWVGDHPLQARRAPGWPTRRDFAERIIACWRNGLYRGQAPAFELDLSGAESLPQWAADFSHVRKVRISSSLLINGNVGQSLPALESLDIHIAEADMPVLAGQLPALNTITELKLDLATALGAYSPALLQALQGMTQLQRLHLAGSIPTLDYSLFTGLRALTLAGNSRQWPAGLLALEGLESVDVSGLDIPSLPDELFSGHEPLWRQLRLNWAALEPQAFMKAFEYFHENSSHLVDELQIVTQYGHQRLKVLVPQDQAFAGNALRVFTQDGVTGRALLARIEALHERYRVWNEPLVAWQGGGVRVDGEQMSAYHREVLADRIRDCWRHALADRYATQEPVAGPSWRMGEPATDQLDLTNYGAPGDLPALGDAVFPQVRRLNLAGAKLTATQLNEFLSGFPQLRVLDLSGNKLTELPQAIETLAHLTELNLSGNELTITASTQARLNRLATLERLNLSLNRVGSLAVTSLTKLVSLQLGRTQLRAWPEGVLNLPGLGFLDLSHSAVTDIPDAAWVGHDALLAGTSLQGCRLSSQALTRVQAFAARNRPGTPLASLFSRPLGIDRDVLATGRTGGDPTYFPLEASEQPDLLLPLPLEAGTGDVPLTSAERLQRLDPQLGVAQAIERIDTWLGQGVSATQIETALGQWREQQVQMIERLNRWIDTPAVRARNLWVSAADRRRAADQLMACWRDALHAMPVAEGTVSDLVSDYVLDFSGMTLGDLPALPVTFNPVGALNLSGVRLTTGSDGFLRAFPRLNRLTLDGNGLGTLPEAVTQCERLVQLSVSDNDLAIPEVLQRQLRSLPQLQILDLGQNRLDTFDVTGLDRLQSLSLRGNHLTDWPVGALEAPALTRLDLRSNFPIERIPPNAFLPEHATLMAGTDLSDNLLLEEEFIRLREHLRETGRGLGFTLEEIDEAMRGYRSEGSDEEPDVHPEQETPAIQKARWFTGVAADSEKHAIWDSVIAQDTTGDFSNIVAQLRNTQDFESDRVNLAERVWEVLQAAQGDPALCERLMGIARASRHRETCGDGRILLFNALEVEVYEFNALRNIDPADKGRALLKLSRSLFRLAQVEAVAKKRIALNPRIDPAEIRLAYRIGLAQRLELPRQPGSMLYRNLSGVQATDLDVAYQAIIDPKLMPAFIEQLAARQYWIDYLQEQYSVEFARVQQALEDKTLVLEDQHADINPAYLQQMDALLKANKAERKALITELSTREIAALGN